MQTYFSAFLAALLDDNFVPVSDTLPGLLASPSALSWPSSSSAPDLFFIYLIAFFITGKRKRGNASYGLGN